MSEVITEVPKQTLLEKYDVPIDHLDFSFVKTCTKIKHLEKIIKILRSREEGFYPDLLKAAEDRLELLDPTSRLLRVEGTLLNKDNLEPQYWKQIFDDIDKWSDECGQKEKELLLSKESQSKLAPDNLPPIRRPPKTTMDKKNDDENKRSKEKISGWDYSKWDKYDADAECFKMDLEETKRAKEPSSSSGTDFLSDLANLASEAAKSAGPLSEAEKELLANKEKERGNEFYKSKDLKEAVRSYTKSIAICPTSFAYNNRAAAFLSLEEYEKAVSDTNKVLQLDPGNIKALYRRAQANEKLDEFSEALSDLRSILKLEPENSLAKSMRSKLKKKHSSAKPKFSSTSKRPNTGGSATSSSTAALGGGDPVPGPSGVNTKKLKTQPAAPKRLTSELPRSTQGDNGNTKKGMRKVDVLEVDREDESLPIFDWRRYYMEGKSAKIEVASKFREKSSREMRVGQRQSEPIQKALSGDDPCSESTPSNNPRTSQDNQIEGSNVSSVSDNLQLGPSNFTQSWDLLTRERAPLSFKAKLLRSVQPHLLQAVIGNKLEEEMLSDLLLCLRDEFKLKTDVPLILEYLNSFPRLDRFSIIKTFLPQNVKQVIQDLMNKTEADRILRKLYM